MHIYIPVQEILIFLNFYGLIGVALYLPSYRWQERFVAGHHNDWFPKKVTVFLKGLILTAFLWPVFLGYNIKTEISYRKKGYL